MMQRPWRTHRHQKKNEAAYAALGEEALKIFNAEPAPVTRIENMIRHDVNQADLSKWRNEGWQVVHYQFVSNGYVLAVVMERVVEVVPEPVEPSPPPSDVLTDALPCAPTITEIVIESNGLVDKLAENKPIFAAICEKGVDAVIDEMNAEVIEKAYSVFHAFAEKDTQIRRFESRLLTAGSTSPEEETITIEVVT